MLAPWREKQIFEEILCRVMSRCLPSKFKHGMSTTRVAAPSPAAQLAASSVQHVAQLANGPSLAMHYVNMHIRSAIPYVSADFAILLGLIRPFIISLHICQIAGERTDSARKIINCVARDQCRCGHCHTLGQVYPALIYWIV
jgi:hypothetical protein